VEEVMKSIGSWVLALSCAWVLSGQPVLAQDRDVPAALRPYMSAEEFHAAGLHKLNPAELAQFQAWFVRAMRAQGDDPLARAPEARVSPAPGVSARDELASERRRLAEERRQLDEERRALEQERARVAEQAERAPDAAPAQRLPADDPRMFGFPGSSGMSRMETAITGTFDGWDGPTRYTFENGQVWETIGDRDWRPRRPMENPAVIIRRGMFDSYTIQVEGYNTRIAVRRIE
jgi:hypothetical protein